MKSGRVSHTALKVGFIIIALNEKAEWKSRLPQNLAALTERLILAAGVFGYGRRMINLNKKSWSVRLYEYSETKTPGTFEGIGERKTFMDEQVLAAITAGAKQVLVLGAGFDTLCLRFAPQFPQVEFFEVDHPATSAAKARGVTQEGQPENMTLLAADLNETPLSVLMQKTERWDTSPQSVVVAEGLFIYLKADVVLQVFREVAACTGPGTRVAFSHGVMIKKHRFANAMLRLIGEPWLSSCASADLPEYIGPGWSVIATQGADSASNLEAYAVVEKYRV
jgi:methyltransferase (TIGR00027 family)